MNQKTGPESQHKRAMLSQLRNAGVASAVVVSTSSGWVKPVINQVILPAHAQCTDCPPPHCATEVVDASLTTCSGDGSIVIEIRSSDTTPLTMTSVPTLAADGWSVTVDDGAPTEFTDIAPYTMIISGPVLDTVNCAIPGNAVPGMGGVALTSMLVAYSFTCVAAGTTDNAVIDILPLI